MNKPKRSYQDRGYGLFNRRPDKKPPAAPLPLKRCEHPGCNRDAHFGFGCANRQEGHWFCYQHRPDQ